MPRPRRSPHRTLANADDASVSTSGEYDPIMWSSACTRFTSATLPAPAKFERRRRTARPARSRRSSPTLHARTCRRRRATTFMRAAPPGTTGCRCATLDTLVTKKRTTSPRSHSDRRTRLAVDEQHVAEAPHQRVRRRRAAPNGMSRARVREEVGSTSGSSRFDGRCSSSAYGGRTRMLPYRPSSCCMSSRTCG